MDALTGLMKTNDYALITVTQICQEAELSRRTFYRLYETKEEILHEYMQLLAAAFMERVAGTKPGHYEEVAVMYFVFWNEHAEFLRLLKKNRLLDLLYHMTENMAPVVFHKIKPQVSIDEETLSFLMSYSLGGLNAMLIRWVEKDMQTAPQQMGQIMEKAFQIAVL